MRLTLQPMLEDECGYTLSLHYPEFAPGAAVVDSIINCIYDSRRIVVVVTPKFLDSEWCKIEVNQGLRRAIKRPNRLIVFMLYEMPLDRLPKALESFLSGVTFLLWDDEKREEMRKKMKRALGTPYTVKMLMDKLKILELEFLRKKKTLARVSSSEMARNVIHLFRFRQAMKPLILCSLSKKQITVIHTKNHFCFTFKTSSLVIIQGGRLS